MFMRRGTYVIPIEMIGIQYLVSPGDSNRIKPKPPHFGFTISQSN
jgi:hypothetical protein